MTDGTFKQVNRDRGGVIDPQTLRTRRDLCDIWYGIHEQGAKELSDGLTAVTPTYMPTSPASCCGC